MSHLLVGTENPATLVVGRHNAELRSPSFGRRLTAQDLLTRSWKMAHRGGSAWRPEMTRKAYLDSAIVGCDVLEFSVGRTSDGVYFGLHDESIDRTTAGSGNASALTWAQVNSYTVDDPRWPGVDPQPHYRLEDFIADFADTHVLMLDPKHIWADGFVQEFFDFVLARTDNTRVVMKFSFPGPGFPDAAAARGFLTWGYAYDSNNPADAQNWDMVGLDIRATAQTWANFRAQGKPLTAHIIHSQTEANLGAQRGATSFQCARPDAVHLRDTVTVGPKYEAQARLLGAIMIQHGYDDLLGGTLINDGSELSTVDVSGRPAPYGHIGIRPFSSGGVRYAHDEDLYEWSWCGAVSFNANTTNSYARFIQAYNQGGGVQSVLVGGDRLRYDVGQAATEVLYPSGWNPIGDEYHFYAYTQTKVDNIVSGTWYVDGVPQALTSYDATGQAIVGLLRDITFGGSKNTSSRQVGDQAASALFDYALTDQDVLDLYAAYQRGMT